MVCDARSLSASFATAKRKRVRIEVADAIRDFADSQMQSELAKQQRHYMEEEDY